MQPPKYHNTDYELFVFDPSDEEALTRCTFEFRLTPDDFSHLHHRVGDLVVIDPTIRNQPIEARLVGPPVQKARSLGTSLSTFADILKQVVTIEVPMLAIVEAAVVSRCDVVQLRLILGDRLIWIPARSYISTTRFW